MRSLVASVLLVALGACSTVPTYESRKFTKPGLTELEFKVDRSHCRVVDAGTVQGWPLETWIFNRCMRNLGYTETQSTASQ